MQKTRLLSTHNLQVVFTESCPKKLHHIGIKCMNRPFPLYSTFVIEARHDFNKVRSHFMFSKYLLLGRGK